MLKTIKMTCLNKQLIINRLPLPDLVSSLIKDFCFVDIINKNKGIYNAVVKQLNQYVIMHCISYRRAHKTSIFLVNPSFRTERQTFEVCNICGYITHIFWRLRYNCDKLSKKLNYFRNLFLLQLYNGYAFYSCFVCPIN